ncbi:MAG: hypothetical protein QME58_12995, partial [Bacteroidota bacterium]|nr:hypothetical protein [Bacteroidota bacterium]
MISKITFLLIIIFTISSKAAIFVSPAGADTNSGTIDLPFKTITKGQFQKFKYKFSVIDFIV